MVTWMQHMPSYWLVSPDSDNSCGFDADGHWGPHSTSRGGCGLLLGAKGPTPGCIEWVLDAHAGQLSKHWDHLADHAWLWPDKARSHIIY